MKILHIITKSEVGGAQTWVKEQAQLFEGHAESYLITNRPGFLHHDDFINTLYVEGIESKFSLSSYIKVLKFVRKNDIDVIIASSANAGVLARLCKVFVDVKVVYISHGWSCVYNGGYLKWLFIYLERILSHITDKIICVSQQDFDIAVDLVGISEKKLVKIRNSILPRERIENRKEADTSFRVLFLGRLSHPKRPELLIEALSNIDDVVIDIVGDGPKLKELPRYDNVNFLGSIPSFSDFGSYDLFCLISDSEGLPMSGLEAASFGLPLILSNVGGCSELIEGNGILVENNVQDIRNAYYKMRSNYSNYKKSAETCRNSFNLNSFKKEYALVYGLDL